MSVRMAQADLGCSATTVGLMAPATTRICGSIPDHAYEDDHDLRFVAGATPHTAVGSRSGDDGLHEVDEVLDEAVVVTPPMDGDCVQEAEGEPYVQALVPGPTPSNNNQTPSSLSRVAALGRSDTRGVASGPSQYERFRLI